VEENMPSVVEGAVQRKVVPELPKPVKMGDEFEVAVNAVGGKGDGIAKKDGFVIFVQGGQKGEVVRIRITELKRSFAVAQKI
jgi:predicted RNA-binding protein with TRAM domain